MKFLKYLGLAAALASSPSAYSCFGPDQTSTPFSNNQAVRTESSILNQTLDLNQPSVRIRTTSYSLEEQKAEMRISQYGLTKKIFKDLEVKQGVLEINVDSDDFSSERKNCDWRNDSALIEVYGVKDGAQVLLDTRRVWIIPKSDKK